MTGYISAANAIRNDIASAEAALEGANQYYDEAEKKLRHAQGCAARAYDGRAANQRNVDRLKKALAILEGQDDE